MNLPITFAIRHVCFLGWFGLLTGLTPVQAQVTPRPADAFVESIGVNIHLPYTDRVYYSRFPELKARLGELGIRHVREGADSFVGKPVVADRINDLYQTLGIRTTFVSGRRAQGYPNPLTLSLIDDDLQGLKTRFPTDLIAAIEGPNEYDIESNHVGETSTSWVSKIREYQRQLYTQVKSDPTLRNIPVIAPSFVSEGAYERVGDLDQYIDYACIHAYQSWRHPGTPGWGDNGYGSLSWQFNYIINKQSPKGKPVQSTECGYHTLPEYGGVPPEIQGKYVTRMFAEFFRRGITRSFKYELIDQGLPASNDRERVFGLLRNDLTAKPAFYAVRDLIGLLAEPEATAVPFKPTSLDYTLAGETKDVRQLLLQKRDGTYYLLLWLEVEGWNGDQQQTFSPAAQRVTVQLPAGFHQAQLHRQGTDGKMNENPLAIENNKASLAIYDRLQVLELGKPDGGGGEPTADIVPAADALVRSGSYQNQNYGSEGRLTVKDNSVNPDYSRQSFLRFDVSTVNANVSLVLTVAAVGDENVTARPVELRALRDDTWQEDKITWANKPSPEELLATLTISRNDVGQAIAVDVTDYVSTERASGKTTVGFVLTQPTGQRAYVSFRSRESKEPPLLTVNRPSVATKPASVHSSASNPKREPSWANTTAEFTMYPNPTRDFLTTQVVSPEAQPAEVVIFRTSGEIVQRQLVRLRGGSNHVDTDVSALSPGLYLVQIRGSRKNYPTRKLIIR